MTTALLRQRIRRQRRQVLFSLEKIKPDDSRQRKTLKRTSDAAHNAGNLRR